MWSDGGYHRKGGQKSGFVMSTMGTRVGSMSEFEGLSTPFLVTERTSSER